MNMMLNKQRGMSLVSLLVGLLVSMLAVLGMTTLFRVVVKNNTEATLSARATSERASAVLITDMHIHDAGFGTDGDAEKNLLLLRNAFINERGSLTGSRLHLEDPGVRSGNALLWRYKEDFEDSEHYCAGLYSEEGNGIHYLPPQLCGNDVADALQLNWERQPLVGQAEFRLEVEHHDESDGCHGFGVAGSGYLSARVKTVHQAGDQEIPLSSTTCLLNFHASYMASVLGL